LAKQPLCRRAVSFAPKNVSARGDRYDVVFDAVGKLSFRRSRRALAGRGRFVTTDLGFLWQNPFLVLATALTRGRRALLPLPKYTKEHVLALRPLLESGEYRAVIDRVYPLAEIVEATRYVETGQKTGNVVVTV
jgi:NADPH:quinone reductase-like Zn-dependent oxidoreductase